MPGILNEFIQKEIIESKERPVIYSVANVIMRGESPCDESLC